MENQVTYSLYKYNSGSLQVFGPHSRRVKYKTIEEALAYVKSFTERMSKVCKVPVERYFDQQIVIVEYTEPYKSRIVGMITQDAIAIAPWTSQKASQE